MSVYHVLRDGTRLTDIAGHVVTLEDGHYLRELMEAINERLRKETKGEKSCC